MRPRHRASNAQRRRGFLIRMTGWAVAFAGGLSLQNGGHWLVATLCIVVALGLVAGGWYVADMETADRA